MGAPVRTIEAALALGIPHVVVRPGTYVFPGAWTFDTPYVVDAPEGAFVTGSAQLTGPGLTLSGFQFFGRLTVDGGLGSTGLTFAGAQTGLEVRGGAVALARLSLDGGGGASFTGCTGTVAGLTTDGVTAPALLITDSELTVTDVAITGAVQHAEGDSGDGVVVDGGSVTIERGHITDPDDRAFFTRRGASTLRDVTFSGGNRPPVGSADDAVVVLDHGEVSGAATCLFATGGGTLTVTNTLVHDCQFGALVGMGAVVDIQDSVFQDCPGGHFSALNPDTRVQLTGNTFERSDATCVALAGLTQPASVTDNVLDGCVGQGISLLGLSGAQIEGNSITNVAVDPVFADVGDGIGLVDAGATMRANTIDGTGKRGIALLRSWGDLDGNIIGATGDVGISVVDPAEAAALIRNNDIRGTVGGGITVFNADATIDANTIDTVAPDVELGTGDGITFGLGSTCTVSGNTVRGAAYNGIVFAEGAAGNIAGNTVTGSGRHGIREYCIAESNSVTVGDNTLSDNALGDQQLCQ